jgi:hypothetical protein
LKKKDGTAQKDKLIPGRERCGMIGRGGERREGR